LLPGEELGDIITNASAKSCSQEATFSPAGDRIDG
jgi:hypothetical protein